MENLETSNCGGFETAYSAASGAKTSAPKSFYSDKLTNGEVVILKPLEQNLRSIAANPKISNELKQAQIKGLIQATNDALGWDITVSTTNLEAGGGCCYCWRVDLGPWHVGICTKRCCKGTASGIGQSRV